MNIFDYNDQLPENPVLDLLKQLKGKTIEYSKGLKTKVIEVNDDGTFECDPSIENKDKFTKYINDYLNNHIKSK